MKLIDLKEMSQRGTYYAVRPTRETIAAMREFMGDHRIPNPLAGEDLHATVVYSRAFVNARSLGKLNPTWKGKFHEFDIFPSFSPVDESENAEHTKCLVMKFHCDDIHRRHDFLRKNHGATHDFATFDPHITMSYNIGDFDHQNLPEYDGPHEFHEEYSEPLKLDGWK